MVMNGVKHIRSAPYHPSTNGAAERLVQTVKGALRSGHQQGMLLEQTLAAFLLGYRTTPHSTAGVAPSTLFLGRDLRTRLDLLRPDIGKHVHMQQSRQKALHDQHARDREFSVGQSVWTRNMREGPCWVPGTVVEILGPVSCLIHVQNGELWRRHIDHLRNGGASPPDTERVEARSSDIEDDTFCSEPLVIQPSSEDSSSTLTQTPESTPQNSGSSTDQTVEPRYPSRIRNPPDRFM